MGGWIPDTGVSEEQYRAIRNDPERYPPEIVAFVGFGCSWGGKWFGGYARGNGGDYSAMTCRTLMRQRDQIYGTRFYHADYRYLPQIDAVWYFDPPYAGTTGYQSTFDSIAFWQYVNGIKSPVFVSEYKAPPQWKIVWEKTTYTKLQQGKLSRGRIERLFAKVS